MTYAPSGAWAAEMAWTRFGEGIRALSSDGNTFSAAATLRLYAHPATSPARARAATVWVLGMVRVVGRGVPKSIARYTAKWSASHPGTFTVSPNRIRS